MTTLVASGIPILVDGKSLTLCEGTYATGGGRALFILYPTGERFLTLTACFPGVELAPGEVAVKTWSENEPFIPDILASQLFVDTGRRIPAGFVEASVWRIRRKND